MTIGVSMVQETCLILGQVSHSSLYWMKSLQADVCGQGRDWRNGKQHLGLVICGHKFGEVCQGILNWKKSKIWAIEKPKLENARRTGGIYFLDPEDKEFKETIKITGKKVEVPTAQAMLCKKTNNWHGETCCIKYNSKSKFACIFEASESTRMRMEGVLPPKSRRAYRRKME